MVVTELYRLFVCSLNMMALRGYCIESYRELIDIYEYIKHCEKNNEESDPDLLNQATNVAVSTKIRNILKGSYNYSSNSKSVRENFTYAVTNYTTGDTCLIFFSDGKNDNFLSGDLDKIVTSLENFSKIQTGDKDFCKPNSGISGVIILRNKMGANPREKTDKIKNIDIVNERNILSCPYDNMMQSQHHVMNEDETEAFHNDSVISRNKLPTIAKSKDNYYGYIGVNQGLVDRIYRSKFSDEEMLDTSLYYRRIK